MLHAWWCGGPFVVPVCDLLLTFGLILYISVEWFEGIFQITGVARIPAVILPTWTAPANALGSLWLPVVFCTAFLLLVLYIGRMLVQVKHARNPLQPGVKHFIFGFTLLLVLGFAGLCGLLAVDVFNAIQIFGVGVNCAPLAGVVNPACLEAKKYFAGRHLHSIVLLTLLTLVGTFGIFGECIIVWSVLRACIFGPQLHVCNPPAVPGCASPCLVAGTALHHRSPRFREHRECRGSRERDYCVPVDRTHAAKLALASGHLSPAAAAILGNEDPSVTIYPEAGVASSTFPSSRVVAHTKYANPSHASCPLDADTQQRLGIENPVANTCKISINTGRQGKTVRNSRGTRVVVGDSSSSSGEEESRRPRRLRKPLSRSTQHRSGRTARRRPRLPSSSSASTPPRARLTRPPSRVPSSARRGTHCTSSNRRQHPGGPLRSPPHIPQPSCSSRCCSACKHAHSHPCKRERSGAHAPVRHSNSCRRTADRCDARREVHRPNSLNRPCTGQVAPGQILRNSPPLLRSSSCCHLPACPADRCAADASPVGVSTNYSGRAPPRRGKGHPSYPAGVPPPTVSLPSQRAPVRVQRRGRSASVGVGVGRGGHYVQSHSSCPHVYPARGGPSTCSKAFHAQNYQGPALIRDHSCCEMQRCRDTPYRHPASYRRFPTAPPFTSHNSQLRQRERLNQSLLWCPSVQQGLSQADACRHWTYGEP